MRNVTLFIGILLLCSTGCVPSLHPIYFEHDVLFDPNLIGVWTDKGGESVEISKISEKEYQVVYRNPHEPGAGTGIFIGHLVKIGGSTFMDLFPKDPLQNFDADTNTFYKSHFVLAHSFAQIIQTEPTLRIRRLDNDWLAKITKDNPQAIRHAKIDRRITLTASTKELQSFLLNNLETEGAFITMSDLRRKADESPPKSPGKPKTEDR